MKKQQKQISKKESDTRFLDHLEFMNYCEKVGKAYNELVARNHVRIMATGEDFNKRYNDWLYIKK